MDAKNALLQADYAPATAHNATKTTVVKDCQREIIAELTMKDITPDMMVRNFQQDRNLAIAKEDIATATRVDENLSKAIGMLSDKQTINIAVINAGDREILTKYISINNLPQDSAQPTKLT